MVAPPSKARRRFPAGNHHSRCLPVGAL